MNYIQWLASIVGIDLNKSEYSQLFQALHERYFFSILGNDNDRAEDGKALRYRYSQEPSPLLQSLPEKDSKCTFLEFLVALAMRIEQQLGCSGTGNNIPEYFYMLLYNIGLHKFKNDKWFTMNCDERVTFVVDSITLREYGYDGSGGLFPLVSPAKDQRFVEIWYQLQSFLQENYPL